MSDGLQNSDAPAARNTRLADDNKDEPVEDEPRSLVSRVRAVANTITLIGAVLFAIGFATGATLEWPPPEYVGRIGTITIAAFLVGFVAILVENARESSHGYDEDDDP